MTYSHPFSVFEEAFREAGILAESHMDGARDIPVTAVSYDSQEVTPGTLFFCKGAHFKEIYLMDSLAKGAVGYVAEGRYEAPAEDVPYLIVNDMRKAMAIAGNLHYEKVWQKLHLSGITGTKGKSTTATYVKYITDAYMEKTGGPESAMLSSIDNYDGVIREESHLTTPETLRFHWHMANAVDSGITHLVMEVSSQALKYRRVDGVLYEVGALLNIGQDHISPVEHTDVEDYVASKLLIFDHLKTAAINRACTYFDRAVAAAEASEVVEKIIVFGIDDEGEGLSLGEAKTTKPVSFVSAVDINATTTGISFTAKGEDFTEEYTLNMPGIFNVENALAAICITKTLGIPYECIKEGLLKARVGGRMEVFTNADESRLVIVDYAHNKMSMQALFDAVRRDYADRKIVICYGCPGKKALGRRQELSEIAGKYADQIIITEEDPGEEDLMKICNEIAEHVAATGNQNYEIIPDRREAIEKAVNVYGDNAVVLLTAKGRETRMKRGVGYEDAPSDVEMTCEVLGIEDPLAKK